ncbi:DUF7507 domain-containing protein [Leucobacter salsicius]|uniref:DUF7507 domain-containing protein n=1 Tax=Leucobacter salsicius TaxID=664638 RepID=UPI00034B8575|nr:DUF11 domain-containing protein [Leucobacter salsicius]
MKRLLGGIATSAVVASSLVFGGATAASATPPDPFSNNAESIYGVRGPANTADNGGIFAINTDTSTVISPAEATGQRNQNRSSNSLGISPDGRYAYTVDNTTTGDTGPIQLRQYDSLTGDTRSFDVPSGYGNGSLRGAVSPINGIFYFSGSANVYAFNPANDQVFQVGTLQHQGSSANGDFTFGRNGTLYTFVAANLYETPASALPTSASSSVVPMRLIANVPAFTDLSSQGANGIAFGGNGNVFGTTTSGNDTYLVEYNMARLEHVATKTISTGGNNFVDLASRHFPNTLTLKIDVQGRDDDADQFQLDIIGEGTLDDDDATTSGSTTGIQDEYAGPVITEPGGNYEVSTTGVSDTDLSNYDLSVVCVDAAGENVEVTGDAPAWDLVFPAVTGGTDVECVITAAPKAELVPSIALTKTADPLTYAAVGDLITYTFLVENDGEVALTNVDVNDALAGLTDVTFEVWPGAPNVLLPTETATGTATLTITQAHLDAGKIDNTATATGTPPTLPGGETPDPVTDTDDATVTGPTLNPALTLEKEANVDSYELGDKIIYTFTIENTGNTTLSGVTVTDPLVGLSALTYTWPAGNADGVLAPGQIATATATYTATQADVDRGFVHNAATATGTPPVGPDPENPPAPPVTPPAEVTIEGPESDPEIELVKTGALSVDENTVTYTFVATNTGNVTLTGVSINDPMTGLSVISYDWDDAAAEGVLEPGDFVTGTATYTVTSADRNAGSIVNLADTVGTPPNLMDPENPNGPGIPQTPVTDEDPAQVDLAQTAAISLIKDGTLDITDTSEIGDLVDYTFTVTNTGNVTLTKVQVTDEMLADAGVTMTIADSAWPGEVGVLTAGQSVAGSASYPLTQADIDAGQVDNVAIATGVSPIEDPQNPGEFITPQDEDDVTVPVHTDPALSLVKTGEFDGDAVAGDNITYGFTVTNTGNQTLTGVTVNDEMLAHVGVSIVFADDAWPGAVGVLAPTESVQASAVYTLTQADIDAGHVYNSASATGTPPTPPGGETPDPLPPVEDDVDLPTPAEPSITLVKTSELAGDAKAGDLVEFTFVATNDGDLTLTGVTINDPLPNLTDLVFDWTEATAAGVLAPGDSVTATASYTLTQADVDNGHLDNTATTVGTPPNAYDPENPEGPGTPREPVEDEDTVVTPLDPRAAITLVKDGVLDGASAAGETITYTFVATNTGDATLSAVTISDPLPGLTPLVFDWDGATAEGVLAPGESVTATATYTLTQADVDAGGVVNLADTVGTPPNAYDPEDPEGPGIPREPVTDEDPAFVPTPQEPAIQLVKTGALQQEDPQHVGDLVEYTFVATNIGNVTLSDVEITDPLVGLSAVSYDWSGATAAGTLAPGEFVTGTATYRLTQADIDAGHVDNVATATGLPPVDPANPDDPRDPVEGQDDVTVPVTPAPAITLVKTSVLAGDAKAGDQVLYTFTGTNTGNVTLTDVVISDPLPGLGEVSYTWPGAAGVLAPGEQVTAEALYVLTQGDVDNGEVHNTATIIGTPPATYDPENPDVPQPQTPVTDDDTAVTPLPASPAIELVKTGKTTGKALAGDKVEYTFVATNTGNVTLSDVVITDPLTGLSSLTYQWPGATGVLAPGESVTATASYTLTDADVRAGKVDNTATVIGFAPNGGDPVGGESVTDSDSATVATGALAITGGVSPIMPVAAGLGLLLLGAGLVLAARKRKLLA